MGVGLGVIIGNSVGKADDDRAGYWLGIILGKLLKTEPGNFEGFSLYWALFIIILCAIWVDACLLGMGLKYSVITDVLVVSRYFPAVSSLVNRQ